MSDRYYYDNLRVATNPSTWRDARTEAEKTEGIQPGEQLQALYDHVRPSGTETRYGEFLTAGTPGTYTFESPNATGPDGEPLTTEYTVTALPDTAADAPAVPDPTADDMAGTTTTDGSMVDDLPVGRTLALVAAAVVAAVVFGGN
jgi:hypothetical protein